MKLLTLLCFLYFAESKKQDDLIVVLPDGKVQGHTLKTWNNSDYYAYYQIPYAAPPVGRNRYQLPKDPVPWQGILNATNNTKVCVQFSSSNERFYKEHGFEITEDCLYLNVYTPNKPTNPNLLPVMVNIHGGRFSVGSGTFLDFPPNFLMDYDIVVVTLNYRLGALGFLTTMDGVIPGNLGLKDQRKALHWIRDNIKQFGGDPNKITISGESAGAFSVSYQLLDKSNKGIFRGAIQQSGSALNYAGFTFNSQSYANALGSILDKTFTSTNSSLDLLKLLQNADVTDIVRGAEKINHIEPVINGYTPYSIWLPVIEDECIPDASIKAPQLSSFMSGDWNQVPLMIGFTSEEALQFKDGTAGENDYLAGLYDSDPGFLVSGKVNILPDLYTFVGSKLKQIYTSGNFADDEGAFVRFSSDAGFTNGILKQAEVASNFVPVYLYQFSYVGKRGLGCYSHGIRPEVDGAEKVGHGEDLAYIWDNAIYSNQQKNSTKDEAMIKRVVKLWTNFVKYQNPTPEEDESLDNIRWPKINNQTLQYLNINDTFEIQSNPRYYKDVSKLLWQCSNPPYYGF